MSATNGQCCSVVSSTMTDPFEKRRDYTFIDSDSPWTSSYTTTSKPYFSSSVSHKRDPQMNVSCHTLPYMSGHPYIVLNDYTSWCDTSYGRQEINTPMSIATTDRTRWACPSLPVIPEREATQFYNFLGVPQRLDEVPVFTRVPPYSHTETQSPITPPPPATSMSLNSLGSQQQKPKTRDVNVRAQIEIQPVPPAGDDATERRKKEFEQEQIDKESFESFYSTPAPSQKHPPPQTLLPITSYTHNIREILKNCILLEDHLLHPEKRCGDCCMKHFLFLEALAEEARTLDTRGEMSRDVTLFTLPEFFRSCSKQWYTTATRPDSTQDDFIVVAQRLRRFRKQYQPIYFPMTCDDDLVPTKTTSSCVNGLCPNSS